MKATVAGGSSARRGHQACRGGRVTGAPLRRWPSMRLAGPGPDPTQSGWGDRRRRCPSSRCGSPRHPFTRGQRRRSTSRQRGTHRLWSFPESARVAMRSAPRPSHASDTGIGRRYPPDPIGDGFVIADKVEYREPEVWIDQSARVRDANACDDGVIDRCRQLVLRISAQDPCEAAQDTLRSAGVGPSGSRPGRRRSAS
jgi:hypothetical protein